MQQPPGLTAWISLPSPSGACRCPGLRPPAPRPIQSNGPPTSHPAVNRSVGPHSVDLTLGVAFLPCPPGRPARDLPECPPHGYTNPPAAASDRGTREGRRGLTSAGPLSLGGIRCPGGREEGRSGKEPRLPAGRMHLEGAGSVLPERFVASRQPVNGTGFPVAGKLGLRTKWERPPRSLRVLLGSVRVQLWEPLVPKCWCGGRDSFPGDISPCTQGFMNGTDPSCCRLPASPAPCLSSSDWEEWVVFFPPQGWAAGAVTLGSRRQQAPEARLSCRFVDLSRRQGHGLLHARLQKLLSARAEKGGIWRWEAAS